MRICQKHWDMLRKAIDDRGLTHLVSKNGEEALQQFQSEVVGIPTEIKGFDPLIAAHNMIATEALKNGGPYLLTLNGPEDNDKHYCPVCEAMIHTSGFYGDIEVTGQMVEEDWIYGPAESAKNICISKGLVEKAE